MNSNRSERPACDDGSPLGTERSHVMQMAGFLRKQDSPKELVRSPVLDYPGVPNKPAKHAMLTSAPTKRGAGITLYGDFFDLDSLHKTIHKIAEEGFMEESTRNFLLGLAYDVRKAKESKRERKVLGFAEDKVKYRGVRILWPIFLPQLAMLRHYAGYRTTDHRDQACLYLLEDCAITSLLAFDAQVGHETAKLLLNLPPFPHDYLFEFCSVCAREYISAPVRGKRFRTLPKTLHSMFWLSPAYQAFAKKMALLAEEKGCSPQSLEDATEWPRFQW